MSRHTRHASGITLWNNAVLIAFQVILVNTTNTEGIATLCKGIWPVFALHHVHQASSQSSLHEGEERKRKSSSTVEAASPLQGDFFKIKCISSKIKWVKRHPRHSYPHTRRPKLVNNDFLSKCMASCVTSFSFHFSSFMGTCKNPIGLFPKSQGKQRFSHN